MSKKERIEKIMTKIGGMLIDCEVSYYFEKKWGDKENARADERRLLEYVREVLEECM